MPFSISKQAMKRLLIIQIDGTAGAWGRQEKSGNLLIASPVLILAKFLPGLLCLSGIQAANY